MRFITEFESTYGGQSQQRYTEKVPYWEERGQVEVGNLIGKAFGWKQREVLSEMRHTLEIEAFPMDKWIEFKEKLSYAVAYGQGIDVIGKLVQELESFGKPSGDTITNPK